MKVVLVIHSLRAGGAERVMSWLADNLVARGHEVTLVVRMPGSTDFFHTDARVKVVRFVRKDIGTNAPSRLDKARGLLAFGRLLRALVKREDPDVVLSFIDMTNLYVLIALMGQAVPVVVSERIHPDWHELGRLTSLRPALYRRAAAVIVQSGDIARMLRKDWRLRQVEIIPNPATLISGGVPPMVERTLRVVSVGRLTDQKDHQSLLKAWAKLGDIREGWVLQIFGAGENLDALLKQAESLEISDSVDILAPVVDIAGELATCRIFVLCSRYEGFPNALLEAMSSGCACISTDAPGASRELLLDGECGVLVRKEDSGDLAAAIARVMSSEALQIDLGQRARARAETFAAPVVADLWETALLKASGHAGICRD